MCNINIYMNRYNYYHKGKSIRDGENPYDNIKNLFRPERILLPVRIAVKDLHYYPKALQTY